jgi:hypothetical protein
MAYGISIQNASGNIVISEDYSNYHRVGSGIFSNGSQPDFGMSGDELLFIRPHEDGYKLAISSYADGHQYSSTSGYVEYAVMRKHVSFPGSYGMRIFQADGATVAFDSLGKPLLPVMTVSNTPAEGGYDATTTTGYAPYTTAQGRKRYISAESVRVVGIAESGLGFVDYWVSTTATFQSNTQFYFSYETFSDAPGGTGFPWWAGTVVCLVVDI